jgi:hypothetical protein
MGIVSRNYIPLHLQRNFRCWDLYTPNKDCMRVCILAAKSVRMMTWVVGILRQAKPINSSVVPNW